MSHENHINRALPTTGHTPMYVMHKFFARKQEDVISEYIKVYTEEGETILDPFCGSGVMIAEALKLDRRAIGIDINPVSIFVTRNTIKYLDTTDIKKEFDSIRNDIGDEIKTRSVDLDSIIIIPDRPQISYYAEKRAVRILPSDAIDVWNDSIQQYEPEFIVLYDDTINYDAVNSLLISNNYTHINTYITLGKDRLVLWQHF